MQTQRPMSTVTPTLDGDVLVALASAPDVTFTTGQIERLLRLGESSKGSLTGIRKVLNRLTTEGVVERQQVGGTMAYTFNSEHLAASPICELARLRATLLERLEETTTAWAVPPVFGALFGSAARGRMGTESDIDLLLVRPVEADEEMWDQQVLSLTAQVRRWTGNDADVLVLDESEVVANPVDPVLVEVAVSGLPFAGRATWLRGLQARHGRR